MLLVALALDALCGDPPNSWHPVAWLGVLAGRIEQFAPSAGRSERLAYGALLTALLVGGSATLGRRVERIVAGWPAVPRVALLAAMLKLGLSVGQLATAANVVGHHLAVGDLAEARAAVRTLVSRPSATLRSEELASAAIESVAENLCDSVVAPILAYAVLGLPGAFGYRALNTLDAMIGYHGEYEDLGRVVARLDDFANLVPARLSALLLVGAAGLGFGDRHAAWSVLRRDRARTESPNAGWPMSAAAGALRVCLAKRGQYILGPEFPAPAAKDVARAVRLYDAAVALGLGAAVGGSVLAQRTAWWRAW